MSAAIYTQTTGAAGNDTFALQSAIGAYSDEAYTTAKKLSGTGIVGPNPNIDTSTETFIGQMRWYKPINPQINVASLTTATAGTGSIYTSDFATYIKTVRTHGATSVNMSQVVTQVDGLAKIGRDFGQTRAQDEHNAILAVLRGVAISEVLYGAAGASGANGLGGQSWTSDPASKAYGFYVDFGNTNELIEAAGGSAGTNAVMAGAVRAQNFIDAIGMAWKDYEPEYAYLVTSPQTLASLRSANLVDEMGVQDGNIKFETIFGGKFRLIQTRAAQGFTPTQIGVFNSGTSAGVNVGVDLAGLNTSFIVLPGAIAMEPLDVPEPTEIYRDGRAYNGGGSTDIWHRWGYVAHPGGYDWIGTTSAFPSDTDYQSIIVAGGAPAALAAQVIAAQTCTGVWDRKASSALSLGILPIFHK